MKNTGIKIIIAVFAIFAVYYIYVLHVTDGIMDMAEKVAAGEAAVEDGTPYDWFRPLSDNIYKSDIKRYFAYCGIKNGKIFVTCENVIISDDGEVKKGRDWFVILIKKTDDGIWEAVGVENKP